MIKKWIYKFYDLGQHISSCILYQLTSTGKDIFHKNVFFWSCVSVFFFSFCVENLHGDIKPALRYFVLFLQPISRQLFHSQFREHKLNIILQFNFLHCVEKGPEALIYLFSTHLVHLLRLDLLTLTTDMLNKIWEKYIDFHLVLYCFNFLKDKQDKANSKVTNKVSFLSDCGLKLKKKQQKKALSNVCPQ